MISLLKYTVVIGKTLQSQGIAIDIDALEITLNKSEELDFGVFTVPATTRFENFQILDRVDITVTDGVNTKVYDPFVIISDKVEPVSKLGYFKHTVTFIESIHKFEKILSSSLYITQPLVGEKKSLLDVLQHIRNVIPFERTSFLSSTRLFDINTTLATYLDGIEAPQFFLNGGSLREMLNSISSYVNAIARLEDNNNLIFSFYNEILSTIGIENDVIYKTLSNQTDKWSSTVESKLENAVSSDSTEISVLTHPSPTSWVSFRSRTLKLADTSLELRVPYPIERITKVLYRLFIQLEYREFTDSLSQLVGTPNNFTIYYVIGDDKYYRYKFASSPEGVDGFVEIVRNVDFELVQTVTGADSFISLYYFTDVSSQILLLDQWKRLDLDRSTAARRDAAQLKINSFYYEIGQKYITNTQLGGIFDDVTAFRAFHRRAIFNEGFTVGGLNSVVNVTDAIARDFRIFFVPYFNSRIRSEKANIIDHPYNSQISINQAERIVSADRLLNNIYGLAQRTGEDEIQVKRYHTDLTESFELGDITSDGFVISNIHYTYYIKYFVVNYQFTRNFNRFSNRIALNQENRPFDVSIGSKTTNRNLIYTEYVELNTEAELNNSLVRREGANVFINTLRRGKILKNKPIHFGTIYDGSMQDVQEGEGIFLKALPYADGNTLNFFWGFDDVIGADDQLVLDAYFSDKGVTPNQTIGDIRANRFIRYTDTEGKLDTFELGFYHELNASEYDSREYPIIQLPSTPLIGGHSNIEGVFDNFTVEKDKAESLSMNYQLAVVPHYDYADKIFVGKEFIRKNNLVYRYPTNSEQYFVYTSTTEKYNGLDTEKVKGAILQGADYDILFEGTDDISTHAKLIVTIPNSNPPIAYKSWGIGDSDGNLYLGVNIDEENIYTVYFNFRNRRTGMSYTFDGRDIQRSISPFISLQSGLTSVVVNINDQQPSDLFEVRIRDVTNDGPYISQTTTNTTFGFGDLLQSTEYEVGVRAFINGFSSPYTTRRIFTIGAPSKIQDVYLVSESTGIRVFWEPVVGARAYGIEYRKIGETSIVTEFASSTANNLLITALDSNQVYGFRVYGFTEDAAGELSDEVFGVVIFIEDFVVTAIPSFNSAVINWTQISNSSGYQVRWKLASLPDEPAFYNFRNIGQGEPDPSAVTTTTLTNLEPTTTWVVGVRALFAGTDTPSNWTDIFFTTAEVPPPGNLTAPTITNNSGFPTTTQASWVISNPNSTPVNLFYDFYDVETNTTTTARGTLAATGESGSSVVATTTGSQGQTKHITAQFKQTNFNDSSVSKSSQTILVSTPMTAPSFVTISDITSSSAKATWEFISDATSGYLVQIRTSPDGVLVEQAVTGQFVVVKTFENLGANTQFFVAVQTNLVGSRPASAFTNSLPFTTDSIPGVPAAPTNLQAVNVTVDGDLLVVPLQWTDNATDEIGYRVYRRLGTSGGFTNISGNLAANTVTYQDTAPLGGTIFYYVAAFNANGESLSNTISVT